MTETKRTMEIKSFFRISINSFKACNISLVCIKLPQLIFFPNRDRFSTFSMINYDTNSILLYENEGEMLMRKSFSLMKLVLGIY